MTQTGLTAFYESIPALPPHIKDKLMSFNVLQLCALVCERPGAKWSGASDKGGPIDEIARRWDLPALARRIENMVTEEPLRTYARVMQVIPGGNPALKEKEARDIVKHDARMDAITERLRKKEPDAVAVGLVGCDTLDDLKRVAREQGLPALDWTKIDGLKNFGLKRMYVGNQWRTKLRREAKK